MHKILRSTLDEGSIFEIKPHYGLSLITAFARINGHPVGVIANNPLAYGGALDGDGAEKQAHFIDMCDYFHIPLVFFVDAPGFAIGPEAERAATLKRGIRAAWAGMQATVPAITIIVRKCYGMGGMVPGDSRLRYRHRLAERRVGQPADRGRRRGRLPPRDRGLPGPGGAPPGA